MTGMYQPLRSQGDVLTFKRCLNSKQMLVALNIGKRKQNVDLHGVGTVWLSTHLDRNDEITETELQLRPSEGLILELSPGASRWI